MKTINNYEVRIPRYSSGEKKFEVINYPVLLESESEIVISQYGCYYIKRKNKNGSELNQKIDDVSISEWKTGLASLDGIRYSFWTYGTKRPETIKKEIEAWITKQYGWLSSIDLSFIK